MPDYRMSLGLLYPFPNQTYVSGPEGLAWLTVSVRVVQTNRANRIYVDLDKKISSKELAHSIIKSVESKM